MENVIHSTFVIVSSLATVLVDKGTSQYPKCVLITFVFVVFSTAFRSTMYDLNRFSVGDRVLYPSWDLRGCPMFVSSGDCR